MQLSCNCHATVMQLSCNCHVTVMQLSCNCHATVMSRLPLLVVPAEAGIQPRKALEERQIEQYSPQHFVSSPRDYQELDSRLRGNDSADVLFKHSVRVYVTLQDITVRRGYFIIDRELIPQFLGFRNRMCFISTA